MARNHSPHPDNLFVGGGEFFVSLPNGPQQGQHFDVDIDHPNARHSLLAFAFLSANGKFVYYIDGKEFIINCNAGDIIICSAILEHAGIYLRTIVIY